ncbi:MAG: 2-hydroxyacid dehydrogenase [Achromobacter pulmonis]|uniref:Glyoxylate/hydroxypyruvate reductase A n=1 Tax=Achromobacter pulmonis TaxID=1389932 RepID=A0A6S7DWB8_9BURK|nr:glyoxylate/hydroxypyruvate reductase A [Achromobacter pulmonis]CAB3687037.1 Glyoxylate/hydroxypyruvate reductase A [Achromobacter pulmonis]CAB3876583.1 Glyoxylate/hydroxypyruvate reductase A [Achromobacter pulmonis]
MRLIIRSGDESAMQEWRAHFRVYAPDLEIVGWRDKVDPASIDYALVWAPEPGRLATFPNLKLIISAGAGVDHIVADPAWPRHLPVARMVTPRTETEMAEFVLTSALMLTRDLKRAIDQQARRHWELYDSLRVAADVRVGIMGLGHLGIAAARLLSRVGFPVSGWSRGASALPDGLPSYAGQAQFGEFLAGADLLVCLLPATDATRGILNRDTFAQLPRGASLINAGRGAHLVTQDLLDALDDGHLHQAVLDVFDPEPLPPESALWAHPGIIITPHCAAIPDRRERARHTAWLIAANERGEALPNIYDPARGY